MDLKVKSTQRNLLRGKYVKLPEVVLEECSLSSSTPVEVLYGGNHSCAFILPVDSKLGDRTKERLNNLLNEPLETQH